MAEEVPTVDYVAVAADVVSSYVVGWSTVF